MNPTNNSNFNQCKKEGKMIKNKKIQGLDFTWEEVNSAIELSELLSFDLEFSRACNLRCLYCYAKSGEKQKNELSFDEIKNFIFQAVKLGAKNAVNIGGGEPLLYKYYWDVLEIEKQLGLKTITFTNGTLITKAIAKRLYEFGENIALKFNSFDEDVQDFLANKKGIGKKIKNALDNLLEVGYAQKGGPELALETIVCKQNYSEIENIYKLCRENNFLPYIEIITEQGNADEYKDTLAITPSEGFKLFEKLLKYDEENFGITWPLTPPIAGQTCKRMLYSAYLTSTGNVQPCPGVEISSLNSNIRNRELKWILKNVEVFKKVRNIFDNIHGPCKTCTYEDCYGCRGTALFQAGDYLASDPTCWHAKFKEDTCLNNELKDLA